MQYARTGEADWDELFGRFGSADDYPVSCVWEELAEHYPQAKVVLTVRDPQKWWQSTISTIYGFRTAFAPWLQHAVPPTGQFVEMVDRLVWDSLFDGRVTEREHAFEVFEQHVEHVRATCPPERLLVFDVADGWEPLCEFLDVPVPLPIPAPQRREGELELPRSSSPRPWSGSFSAADIHEPDNTAFDAPFGARGPRRSVLSVTAAFPLRTEANSTTQRSATTCERKR